MKTFLEKELGWKTLQAMTAGHGIMYLVEDPSGRYKVVLEIKADRSIRVTLGGETRNIPNPEAIGEVLGRKATKLDQGRILYQVLEKLMRKHREPTKAEIEDMMERFSRGHL